MSIRDFIKQRRAKIERDLASSPKKKYFSPAIYSQYKITLPMIKRIAHGSLIDLGCGDMPFREFIDGQVDIYHGLDLYPRTNQLKYIADIQDMSMIEAQSYDVALCIEVLEHVPNPFQAAKEIRRIVKVGGYLIVSVPHLSRLHDEPYDFYRYTKYGIKHLLVNEGFEVLEISKRGGIFSFIGHQISTVIVGFSWVIPILNQLIWWINAWVITRLCFKLDSISDKNGLFAMGYTLLAKRIS